jgi:hypothetical protein
MSWAVYEEGVDCYSVCIEILVVSSHLPLAKIKADAKGSPSSLSGRAGSRWFIVISNQEHSLIPIHPRPATISTVPAMAG